MCKKLPINLIRCLFYVAPELTDLRSGDRLTMLLQTSLASIIMYHPQIEADHSNGNTIVEKVNAAADSAGTSAEEFKKWSDLIKARFEDDNYPNSPRNDDKEADMDHISRGLSTSNRISQRAISRIQKLEAELSSSTRSRYRCSESTNFETNVTGIGMPKTHAETPCSPK